VMREVRPCDGKYYSWGQLSLVDAPVGRMFTVSARLTRHAFCTRQRSYRPRCSKRTIKRRIGSASQRMALQIVSRLLTPDLTC
jgi:hypothetical protein